MSHPDDWGYNGGPTPEGYTDVKGEGKFMEDANGKLLINPNYRDYINDPDNRIDWTGVAMDLITYGAGSAGWLATSQLSTLALWMITTTAFWLDHGGNQPDVPNETLDPFGMSTSGPGSAFEVESLIPSDETTFDVPTTSGDYLFA